MVIRAGFFQFRPLFGRPGKNLQKVLERLKNVQADVIVLPELAFTGYFFQNREEVRHLAEDPRNSRTVEQLTELCRQQDFYLVTGFAEKQADRLFNSALLIGPEGLIHTYRKLHLFHEEKHWFDPGDLPLEVVEIRGARIGMMVCFDWIFPEVTRALSVKGMDVLCHPSNLVLSYCQQAMLTRCLENNIFAITANRFGKDRRPQGELHFTGKSQIAGPRGELLYRAPSQREVLYVTEIDLEKARNKAITPLNHLLEDRRPQFYKDLCK